MITFWERFVVFREHAEDPQDKIYEMVMTRIDIMCEICFAPLTSHTEIVRHCRD